MMRKPIVWLLCCTFAIGAFLFAGPAPASACSCAGPAPVQEELNRKSAVFSGTVKDISGPSFSLIRSSADPVQIKFEVKQVWKGELHEETDVYTAMSSASCGYDSFTVGREYIVFASVRDDRLVTGLCDRTKLLVSGAEELAVLGSGHEPLAGGGGPFWTKPVPVTITVIAALLAAGGIWLAASRRKRRL